MTLFFPSLPNLSKTPYTIQEVVSCERNNDLTIVDVKQRTVNSEASSDGQNHVNLERQHRQVMFKYVQTLKFSDHVSCFSKMPLLINQMLTANCYGLFSVADGSTVGGTTVNIRGSRRDEFVDTPLLWI